MSASKPKVKRRIIPIQISADAPQLVPKPAFVSSNLADNQFGARFIDYLKYTGHDKYQKDIDKKAKKYGYEDIAIGTSQPKSKQAKAKAVQAVKAIVRNDHAVEAIVKRSKEDLGNLKDYIVEYSRVIKHSKTETLHDYLERKYKDKMFYSGVTKRFRKLWEKDLNH